MNKELKDFIAYTGIFKRKYIESPEASSLPEDQVFTHGKCIYTIDDRGLTEDEVKIALLAKQVTQLQSIRSRVTAILVFSIITAVVVIIAFSN